MKLVDAKTIQSVDRLAVEKYGMSGLQLMENAGRGVAEAIKRELSSSHNKKVSIIAGKGNNGGDGFVAARHLMNAGVNVSVFSLAELKDIKGDAGVNASIWYEMAGEVVTILSAEDIKKHESALRHSSIIVDSIFGTGLGSPVTGLHAEVIDYINGLDKEIIAVDMPSGIDASTGSVLGTAVKADLTLTMALPKLGLYTFPGREYAGRVEVIDIGVPEALLEDIEIKWSLISDKDMRFLRPRRTDSHKGLYGHLLILAASPGLTGAAYMCGMGSMRIGAGLSTIGVPESLNAIMEEKTTEVMTAPVPETKDKTFGIVSLDKIRSLIQGKTALVIGPGIGNSPEVFGMIEAILKEVQVPTVLDADGLNAFKGKASALKKVKTKLVLTPHPGEAARLLETDTAGIQNDRIGAAVKLSGLTGATVVLKGAGTVIASPNGRVFINPSGNPGLATAGTGDVLSGMLGGLLAQGYEPVESSTAAAYIHGLAGDEVKKAQGELGMMATDLLEYIPKILNSFVVGANG